ncbi:hypothetical protein [Rhizobium sp. X9]|uniref:hypothetical protein n=1 Tax=Rhizobium sp. X9 TaxID=2815360 RepID=UPI001C0C9865|nr:hypothetical protein [Rhizobium sp. X9]
MTLQLLCQNYPIARQIQLSRSPKGVSASKFLVPILLLSPDRMGLSALSPGEADLSALFSSASSSAFIDAIALFSSSWAFASVTWESSDCFSAICAFNSETVEDEVEEERTETAMLVPETAETMGRLVAELWLERSETEIESKATQYGDALERRLIS